MLIYLIGYSYSGKSTMGKRLAELLGYDFFDTDEAIEQKYHVYIPVFFKRYGEQAFRIIESQILESTADMRNTVVATGGGASCSEKNIHFITEHGLAVYLQMTVDDIMERIAHARRSRPSLSGMNTEEKKEYISEKMDERLQYYSQAPIVVPALHTTAEILKQAIEDYTSRHGFQL
ncbi:MAG: shikimate kinase [Bacteroidales bacterium]|nr:shikimate kinase [Bacteroidales bacterium]